MTRLHLLLAPIIAVVLLSAAAVTQSYRLTDDYAIRASTKGVDATFTGLEGTVVFDEDDLGSSRFDVSVSTASIKTGNKTQDKHARGDNWLNAEAHPRISFQSTTFVKTSTGYDVTGDFTINGQTHPETIAFTFDGTTFAGQVDIERERYGIEGPFLFGSFVGDVVQVEMRVVVE